MTESPRYIIKLVPVVPNAGFYVDVSVCLRCGCGVWDIPTHDQWHDEFDK